MAIVLCNRQHRMTHNICVSQEAIHQYSSAISPFAASFAHLFVMATLMNSAVDKRKDSMAVATQRVSALPRPSFKPIIEHTLKKPVQDAVKFDPKKHLAYTPPTQVTMMKDIGYAEDTGISPMAVSQPFQLFSPEAIQQMRAEIFKPEVMENCSFSSNIAARQLRGYASK